MLGHLRPVKDPFRTAMAVRQLPPSSRIQVVHVGGALTDDMKTEADAEESTNPRYRCVRRASTLAGTPRPCAQSAARTNLADGGAEQTQFLKRLRALFLLFRRGYLDRSVF